MNNISKGDLCMVVGPLPCCGWTGWIGKTVTAGSAPAVGDVWCPFCMWVGLEETVLIEGERGISYPRSGLRRIPPLGELDCVETADKVPA